MSRTVIILLVALAIFSSNVFAYSITKLTCNRDNEEYKCGSACQTTCDNLFEDCPIVNVRCNDACYCKYGYARLGGDNGPCIPIRACPGRLI